MLFLLHAVKVIIPDMGILTSSDYTAAASIKLCFICFLFSTVSDTSEYTYKEALIHISLCLPLEKLLRRRNFQSCRFYTGKVWQAGTEAETAEITADLCSSIPSLFTPYRPTPAVLPTLNHPVC